MRFTCGWVRRVHLMRHGPKRFFSFLPLVTSQPSVNQTQKLPVAESSASLEGTTLVPVRLIRRIGAVYSG